MEPSTEPLALRYVRKSMRLYHTIFTEFWGKTPLEWDKNTLLLDSTSTTNAFSIPTSLSRWGFLQIFCVVIYGIGGGAWYVLCSPAPLDRKGTNIGVTTISITMAGVAFYMVAMAKEIELGYNALLEFQGNMIRVHQYHWNQIENEMKNGIKLTGRSLFFGVFVWAYSPFNAVVGIIFNIDLGYEVLGNVALKYDTIYGISYWPALLFVRFVICFLFLICISRTTCFILLYMFLVLQAYICVLATIFRVDDPMNITRNYQAFLVLHAHMTSFLNEVNGLLMFFGHSTSVAALWVGIRGYDNNPVIFIVFMLAVGFMAVFWIFFQLTVLSRVGSRSASVKVLLSNKLQFVKGKYKREELRLKTKCLYPAAFSCGTSFPISEESPGAFFMKVIDNLTSVLLSF